MFIGSNISVGRMVLYGLVEPVVVPDAFVLWDSADAGRNYVTATGDAQLDGSGALSVGSASIGSLTMADSTDWDLPGDFTIHCYINIDSLSSNMCPFGRDDGMLCIQLQNVANQNVKLVRYAQASHGAAGTVTPGTWYYLAIARSGSTVRVYLDDTKIIEATDATAIDLTYGFYVGIVGPTYGDTFKGKIQRFEFINGTALYTSDTITPPARTDAITIGANTVFAPDLSGPSGSTTIVDLSTPDNAATAASVRDTGADSEYAHAIQSTAANRPDYIASAYNSEPCLRFNGTSDEYATSADATNGFTMWAVVKVDTATGDQAVVGDGTSLIGFSAGKPHMNFGSALTAETAVNGSLGVLAAVVNGASSKLFWNGTLVKSGDAGSNNVTNMFVGSNGASEYFDGDVCEIGYDDTAWTNAVVVAKTNALKTTYGIS